MTDRRGEPDYRASRGDSRSDAGAEDIARNGVGGDSDSLRASRHIDSSRVRSDASASDYSRSNYSRSHASRPNTSHSNPSRSKTSRSSASRPNTARSNSPLSSASRSSQSRTGKNGSSQQYGGYSTQNYSRSNYGQYSRGTKSRSRGSRALAALIALLAVCGIGFGIFWYFHTLPVQVTVNGIKYELDYKTTYQNLHDQGMLVATYGDFLAVDGSVIQQGGGTIYKIFNDGKPVADYSTRLHKNDVVTEARGDNVTEESDIAETVIPWTWDIENNYNFYNGSLSLVVNEGTDGVDRMETGRKSGITILSPTSVKMVPRLIRTYTVEPADGQKVIALTFDDGPNPDATPQMLDLLNEYNAKATFFMLGQNVEAYPELAKKVAEQGSQVASHSYSHASSDYLDRISSEAIASQLSSAQTAIAKATGVTTTIVRPPGGNFDYESWSGTGKYLTAAVGWDIDTEDWKKPGADVIADRAIGSAKSGYIILMHDGGGNRNQSVAALRKILETLTAQGYTFVTVDELIQIQRDQLKAEGVIPS